MTDTGATYVALNYETAIALGYTSKDLRYTGRSSTANGVARVAPVKLDYVRIGGIVRARRGRGGRRTRPPQPEPARNEFYQPSLAFRTARRPTGADTVSENNLILSTRDGAIASSSSTAPKNSTR